MTDPNNLKERISTKTLVVEDKIVLKDGCVIETPNRTELLTVDSTGSSAKVEVELPDDTVLMEEVTITKANILAMNGTPVTVVASPGAGKALQFLNATLIFDYATAQYGGGGDVSIGYDSGDTVSSTVAAANSFGATGDKVYTINALNAAGGYSALVDTALVITNATGAFTDPGTAAGVGRLKIQYRIITTDL